MTLNQYIKLFTDIASAHNMVKSFGVGQIHEYLDSEGTADLGTNLFLEVENSNISGNVITDKFTLYCMDYVNKDVTNRNEVLSDTKRILEDVLALLHNPIYYDNFFFDTATELTVFYDEKFANEACGWYCVISLKNDFVYDSCQIPLTGIPITSDTYAVDCSPGFTIGVPSSRTLTINGVTYDLSADRTWTVSSGGGETLAQTLVLGNTTGGTDLTISSGDSLLFGTKGVAEFNTLDNKIALYNTTSGAILNLYDSGVVSLESLTNNIELNAPFNSIILNGTNVTYSNLTASTVPYLDASKNLVSSAVTPTQLGYLDATSSIQTQLNAKQATLVSATNIKTVGGVSLLGAGDIGSISTTYTDAKIKGAIAATSGLIPYGTGTADTVTSASTFLFNGTSLLVGASALIGSGDVANFYRSQNGGTYLRVTNNTVGTVAQAGVAVSANNGSTSGVFVAFNSSYTSSGLSIANSVGVLSNLTAGLVIGTTSASSLTLGTNNISRASIDSSGFINLGTYGTPSAQRLVTIGDASAWISAGSLVGTATTAALYFNQATPSSTNYTLWATSSQTVLNGTSVNIRVADGNRFTAGTTGVTISTGQGSAGTSLFQLTTSNNSSQTAGANVPKMLFTLGTTSWATGALAQADFVSWTQPSVLFSGASTATLVSTFTIKGAPIQSTNATVTTSVGLLIESGTSVAAGTTTAYGAYINEPTGAGTNYALGVNGVSNFLGNVRLTQTVTTEAVASDTTVTIVINGTTYKLLARA